jgi:hypothetical protein
MKKHLLGSVALIYASCMLPASATMPNPNTVAWLDHSKSIRPGADSSPQHFALALIQPKNGGKYDVTWTCENGQRGSGHDATYTIEFMHNDEVLASEPKECHLGRSEVQFKQRREIDPPKEVDLSRVIDRVTGVRISAKPNTPVARNNGRRCSPGTMLPPPICDRYHPGCETDRSRYRTGGGC